MTNRKGSGGGGRAEAALRVDEEGVKGRGGITRRTSFSSCPSLGSGENLDSWKHPREDEKKIGLGFQRLPKKRGPGERETKKGPQTPVEGESERSWGDG